QVALGIMSSKEYEANFVLDDYNLYFGRDATAGEIRNWVTGMQAGLSAQTVSAFLLASDECYFKHGRTNAAWLNGLYQDLLGRSPDVVGQAAWNQALTGGSSRFAVAAAIVTSQEADTRLVESVYRQLLERNANPTELNTWV